jgi:tRNA A37 threonylcarbamoyladenosine modification protein TsaB
MKILIDTTVSKKATVTLFDADLEIASEKGADALVLVSKVLKVHKLKLDEVDFELKNEPGSYTGLKVGASVVNTLNFLKGKTDLVIPQYQTDSD